MDALTRWFEAQATRERRAVLLEDALLGNRFAPYFAYRLRFFLLRYGVASGVQLLKVLLLHRLLGQPGFISLVAVVALASLVSAAWWGALEVLRARVRWLYRFESAHCRLARDRAVGFREPAGCASSWPGASESLEWPRLR